MCAMPWPLSRLNGRTFSHDKERKCNESGRSCDGTHTIMGGIGRALTHGLPRPPVIVAGSSKPRAKDAPSVGQETTNYHCEKHWYLFAEFVVYKIEISSLLFPTSHPFF